MPLRDMITENGYVAQQFLQQNRDTTIEYDTIVIGSGMGGGVVASALADENKRVLVLEAGSLLFPTHIGNLPRRLMVGAFQKHIWSLWDRFSVESHDNEPNSEYRGAQGFNLGGRSIFWGSSIPPLADWELGEFPKEIREYLLDNGPNGGYELARGVYNSDVPVLRGFHDKAVKILKDELQTKRGQGWEVLPAPVAVEYIGATEWSVPAGIFSTADLLLEDALATGSQFNGTGRFPLTVNLNHPVNEVIFDPNNPQRVNGVRCYDMLNKRLLEYRAKTVVICAGTVESAKIALRSKIKNDLIGRGIVDHPIYYRHFVIPPKAMENLGLSVPVANGIVPPRQEPQSTKILIRHQSATRKDHAFDIVMELGAQWNQGRFVDSDHIQDEMKTRGGNLLCELVFQFYCPLMQENYVRLGGDDPIARPRVYMQRYPLENDILQEARGVADTILRKLEAVPAWEEPALFANDGLPDLFVANVGGVAHEVGTLRMTGPTGPGVVDANCKFEGYQNLFACDNSVFPCSPAGNPSLTLVALARRCAKAVAKVAV